MLRGVNQELLAFCTWHYTCKKHKIDVKGRQSGAPGYCLRVGLLTVRAIGSKPLAYVYLGKASWIVWMRRNACRLVWPRDLCFES
jgi:hypothetical protein